MQCPMMLQGSHQTCADTSKEFFDNLLKMWFVTTKDVYIRTILKSFGFQIRIENILSEQSTSKMIT